MEAPSHIMYAMPSLPCRSGNTVPFLLRNQMQETPLNKEATVFRLPAAVPRLFPLLPAANETQAAGIAAMPIKQAFPHSPFFIT